MDRKDFIFLEVFSVIEENSFLFISLKTFDRYHSIFHQSFADIEGFDQGLF